MESNLDKYKADLKKLTDAFVPILDMTKEWTDEKLYARYELTKEEINFIESKIRPMD